MTSTHDTAPTCDLCGLRPGSDNVAESAILAGHYTDSDCDTWHCGECAEHCECEGEQP